MSHTLRNSADGTQVRDGKQIRTERREQRTERRQGTRAAVVAAVLAELDTLAGVR